MREVDKICDFWLISRCISVRCEIGLKPRLLLITNRKSYTGSQLALNSMILNAKIGGFMDFFGDFGLRHKSTSFTRWRHATIAMRSR